METRLLKLQSDFNNIINIRTSVKNIFDTLQIRIDKLHEIYSEFIKTNKNDMFVFGLDSFHFQNKLIDIEYDDMKRLFLAINNRMYCEYFKLHKIIVEYISKNINDRKAIELIKINNYPIYKDLEPFKEYKFELILDLHDNILNLLGIIISLVNNKDNELSIYKTKQNIGLNIDNFITTFNFNINVMREKIIMFINYIEFFHKMHTKYLKRFSNKIQLIYTHINNDIKFDDAVEVSKNKKKELINDIVNNNPIDKELLKELKTSIGSESNSENGSDISKSSSHSNLDIDVVVSSKYDDRTLSNINTLSETAPLNKKNYKNLFKKNVHKVTNMLLFKPKIDKAKNQQLSDSDLQNIFSGIDKSCDSIIDNNENIGLNIEYAESKDDKSQYMSFDTDIDDKNHVKPFDFNKHNTTFQHILKDNNQNETIINENKTNEITVEEDVDEDKETHEEIISNNNENFEIEEQINIEDIKYEESNVEQESNPEDMNIEEVKSEIVIEEPTTKKKRKYNKKKK